MQAVLDRAVRAVPPEVPGWTASTDDRLDVPSQCKDDDPRPWSYEGSRRFDRVDDRVERDTALMEAGTEYQAARQANQASMDATMAKIQELAMAAMAAAEAGDYDRVDQINAEIEQLSAEAEALMQGANDTLDEATEESNRDRWIYIAVEVNPGWAPLGYQSRAVATPSGATHAFRWNDPAIGPGDQTELILLGSWQLGDDSCDQITRGDAAQAVVQGIAVRVTADESRIDSLVAAIDFAALAALVSR